MNKRKSGIKYSSDRDVVVRCIKKTTGSYGGHLMSFKEGYNYNCIILKTYMGLPNTRDVRDIYFITDDDGKEIDFSLGEFRENFVYLQQHREKVLKDVIKRK